MTAASPMHLVATACVAAALLAGCGGVDTEDADPTPASLTGDDTVIDFGERRVGDTAEAMAVLANCCIGPQKVRALTGIQAEVRGTDLAVSSPCGSTRLDQAAACAITLRWQPLVAGPMTGTLIVRADPPAPARELPVRGVAVR